MTIIEAIKSGRPFRRPLQTNYTLMDQWEWYSFRQEDLLADDWEVEEPKITVTLSEKDLNWLLPEYVRTDRQSVIAAIWYSLCDLEQAGRK